MIIFKTPLDIREICAKLEQLGYGRTNHVRMYGEEFEIVSNPFPQDEGIAVHAIARNQVVVRTLRLPLPILQMATNSLAKEPRAA